MRLILASGQSIELVKDTYTIGRAANNDIVLPDSSVSRTHCRLHRQGAAWFIEDLKSQNGTFLNQHRITSAAQFRESDNVRVGNIILQVVPSQAQTIVPRPVAPTPARPDANSRALGILVAVIGGAVLLVALFFVLINLNSGPSTAQPTLVSGVTLVPPATETDLAAPTAVVINPTTKSQAQIFPTQLPATSAPPPRDRTAAGFNYSAAKRVCGISLRAAGIA